ncbi:MAG: nitrate reductase [Verrucomicrobia bacterium]|nr:nitrate reductase [Verrucomicrobiota bacterium]
MKSSKLSVSSFPEKVGGVSLESENLKPAASNSWLRQWTGPLTADLVRTPGQFGLGQVPARLAPDATTKIVCGFCSTGCALDVHLQDGQAVNLSPTNDYPVNLGMACPKGWEALTPLAAPDRGTTPLLRNPATGALEPVDWDHALQVFTLKFKALLDQHGPESVAVLSTGQICTEEMALLGVLFKFGMGGLHCDSNTRQCMATSHVAYKQSFGFDAPPYTYADFEESDVLVFIGSNLCVAHPIMWQRVLRNRRKPKIIVIDPRKTETAMAATEHLALAPKSDLVLLYGIANLLVQNDWLDRAFIERSTIGFAEFAEFVRQFTPDKVAAETGLTVGQLYRFAETIYEGKAVSFWWTMGVNQGHEATRTAQAIINLALMTGNIGRPGTGANSVTGQCNAMGSRLFANATGLPGGRDFANPTHRDEVARILGISVERIPDRPSLAYDQIIDGIAAGRIKGLWVIATNPSHSWIGRGGDGAAKNSGVENSFHLTRETSNSSSKLDRIFDKLEFLVVQDMFTTTETARRADLFLPAAGWGEKEGTFINSERRIGVVKKVARAPGAALADFHIFRLVAHYWGCDGLFREWTSPQAAFQILKRLSAGRPCDFTGIADYRHLDECGGIQWPFVEMQNEECGMRKDDSFALENFAFKERRLFADGKFFHADGKAKFLFEAPRAMPEQPDADFPFLLLTGRGSSAQWHTLTRTNKSDVLVKLGPRGNYLELHPSDARRLRIRSGQRLVVTSRRGAVEARAQITAHVQPGQVFMPMHYAEANHLTLGVFDPYSRQPSYKACAVAVARAINRV